MAVSRLSGFDLQGAFTQNLKSQDIRKGAQLRHVDGDSSSRLSSGGGGDSRSNLMSEIQAGAKLKHVAPDMQNRRSAELPTAAAPEGSMMHALQAALAQRRTALEDSSGEFY